MAPLFSHIEPPIGLYEAVMARIDRARRSAARVRFAAFAALAFVSVLLVIPAIQYAASEFYASGFYDYASLFFDNAARGYSGELLYSLADSLPSLAVLLVIATGASLAWSLNRASVSTRDAFARVVTA